jgi:hypothetical protein
VISVDLNLIIRTAEVGSPFLENFNNGEKLFVVKWDS